jgi:hypothetical protein
MRKVSKKQTEVYRLEATKMARLAQCRRGRGGAVIVAADGEIIGRGYNAPPQDDAANAMCDTDYRVSSKPKSDRTCCVHAEWRAIIDALRREPQKVVGATLYFTNVDEAGEPQPSGDPYCTVCSRLALDVGLAYFVLFHADGPEFYPTDEYNWKSYEYHREG